MNNNQFIMTIDGPGGSGKDTLADNLVSRKFVGQSTIIANTGNFSRSIAYQAVKQGVTPADANFKDFAIQAMYDMDFFGIDPAYLFTAEVEQVISSVAGIPEIRAGFAHRMPEIIADRKEDIVIILGRITGSVFPNADLKLYLETSPDICAHRRAVSRSQQGENYNTVLQALLERNKNDVSSWNKDFQFPHDTVVINTDHLTQIEVYDRALSAVRAVYPG